jgi:hypothetical protein
MTARESQIELAEILRLAIRAAEGWQASNRSGDRARGEEAAGMYAIAQERLRVLLHRPAGAPGRQVAR